MKDNIYQFKITLENITPSIWRRILVPDNYSFWDLHVAIQDSMGWKDSHMHGFRLKIKHSRKFKEIGIPIPEEDKFEGDPEIIPGWDCKLSEYFVKPGITAEYEYDFGDSWIHEVLLEAYILPIEKIKYPICIDGERACPPEDCGGEDGLFRMLEIRTNPSHEEYDEVITWLGKDYHPEVFDPRLVKFDNPKKRLKAIIQA